MRRSAHAGRGALTPLLFWPGASWLHRMPVGAKVAALLIGTTLVAVIGRVDVAGAVAAGGVAASLSAGVPPRVLAGQARPLVLVFALLLVVQALIGRWEEGVVATTRLLAVAAMALAVTLTTPAGDVVRWLERGLTRLRVPPRRVFRLGLMVGLALRSLDHLGIVAGRVLDARRARGLGRSLRAFAVPTVVAAARFAHGVGEALEARGIADASAGDIGVHEQ